MAESLFRSGTTHGHDEPPHLTLRNAGLPSVVNRPVYAGPESRYCPAGAPAPPPSSFKSRLSDALARRRAHVLFRCTNST
jgi:hypothetical protein